MKSLAVGIQVYLVILLLLLARKDSTTVAALHLQLHRHDLQPVVRSSSSRQSSIQSLRHGGAAAAEPPSFKISSPSSSSSSSSLPYDPSSSSSSLSSSRSLVSACLLAGALLLGGVSLLQPLPVHAAADADVSVAASPIGRDSIAPCNKLVGADKNAKNCVSTASVKQLDLYAAPWTFSSSLTNPQVLEYLQQALRDADRLVEIVVPPSPNVDTGNAADSANADTALRAQTTRALAKDQLDFYINRNDRVIQFVSRQVEGPDVSDLGMNRKRLEEVRKRTPFGVMGVGGEMDNNEPVQREGALGQLKAFYGLQSGSGFESVFNED